MNAQIKVLILHGGAVNLGNCSATNKYGNDVPCNFEGQALPAGYTSTTPADFLDVQNLLVAQSLADAYNLSVTAVNISATGLPFVLSDQTGIQNYFNQFDVVIFFKHWSTAVTNSLQNALVAYADAGGGVMAIHHGMYNDLDGSLN